MKKLSDDKHETKCRQASKTNKSGCLNLREFKQVALHKLYEYSIISCVTYFCFRLIEFVDQQAVNAQFILTLFLLHHLLQGQLAVSTDGWPTVP
jgi:hypothetical protein